MSTSPIPKATKVFKLERTSSGVFRRRLSSTMDDTPPYPEDTLSQISTQSSVIDQPMYEPNRDNELSKSISATVKLKATPAHYDTHQKQRPQPSPQRPSTHTRQKSSPNDHKSSNLNYDFMEILNLTFEFLQRNSGRVFEMVKSSQYVATENDGQLHLHSFIYGFAGGVILMMMKPWIYKGISHFANIAFHTTLCIALLMLISVSLSQRHKRDNNVRSDLRDHVVREHTPLPSQAREHQTPRVHSPVRRPVVPLRDEQYTTRPVQPLYKVVDHNNVATFVFPSASSGHISELDNDEDEEEDDGHHIDDDNKSLFSVLTNAHNNMFNSKKNYKNFIEQTKKLKMIS